MDNQNYYDRKFETALAHNGSMLDASLDVIEAYLDNKPFGSKKKKVPPTEKHQLFWHSEIWQVIPLSVYKSESFALALAKYFSQDVVSNFPLLQHIACESPLSVKNAVRYSELVLRPNSKKWEELQRLTKCDTHEFDELIAIIKLMHKEHEVLLMDLEQAQRKLTTLSPLTFLIYISLFAFEHLLAQQIEIDERLTKNNQTAEAWSAFKNIVAWRLKTTKLEDFNLTEKCILKCVKEHLSPLLFPSTEQEFDTEIYNNISDLITKQIALNSFISQSVNVFCFDDSVEFKRKKGIVVIEVVNDQLNLAWKDNGHKIKLMDSYWLNRGVDELIASGMAQQQIGSKENHDANQFAIINTYANTLRLVEVYGLYDYLTADSGLRVSLYEALLSINLMSAFYNKAFIAPYQEHLSYERNWLVALSRLAFEGLAQGENRFPITWSTKKDKVSKFKNWTVNKTFPNGSVKAAEAIVDFWSFDLKCTARKLQNDKLSSVVIPELYERPIFTLGKHVFELPWMVAFQNNSTAAINNLRRIGAGRIEARAETAAIEARLATILESRGFAVQLNYQPAKTPEDDPGEIDIICALDNHVLVLEVKSTFLRSSKKDAWFHKTRTLRKAGKQISRKVKAVEKALLCEEGFKSTLELGNESSIPEVTGLIVDTSLEHDHEQFSGYLKVSLEEVIIALRDDCHLLCDITEFTEGNEIEIDAERTLYPSGFSINSFLKVIEEQQVWKIS